MDTKAFVKKAVDEVLVKKDPALISKYWDKGYIQHDPDASDGLEGFKWFVEHIKKFEVFRTLAEGDVVVMHCRASGLTPKLMIVFHVYLVKSNKIVEHWDVMKEEAEKTASGRTQVDGPTEVGDVKMTGESKRVVQGFVDEVLLGGKFDRVTDFISTEKYYQHNPMVEDGLDGFGRAMEMMKKQGVTMKYTKVHKIVAEGEFVFLHSEGEFGGKHTAFADLFRVENGKITEHWDTIQAVPEKSANPHSMFDQVTK